MKEESEAGGPLLWDDDAEVFFTRGMVLWWAMSSLISYLIFSSEGFYGVRT